MISWHISLMLSFFPLFVHLSIVHNPNVDSDFNKNKIHNITLKIDKIAHDLQSQPANKIEYHLSNIKNQLQKAAQHLGEKGKKYVELIMEGIVLKAFNNSKDDAKTLRADHIETNLSKEDFLDMKYIDNLTSKIDLLIKDDLDRLKTPQNKHKLLESLKKKILETVDKKQKEISLIENLDTRRNLKINDENVVNSYSNVENIAENINYQAEQEMNSNVGIKMSKSPKSAISSPLCENAYDRVCLGIKNMNNLKCLYGDVFVTLDKLCNDNIDCPDGSDEKYCGSQAMERMQYSNWVITNIESYLENNCFEIYENGTTSTKRNEVILDILQMQREFKEKYKNFSLLFESSNLIVKGDSDYEAGLKIKAKEITLIISSFAKTLDGLLCSQRSGELETRRNAALLEINVDKITRDSSWPPKPCKCNKEHCPDCSDSCKRICWQLYSLNLWNCESVGGTDTVSLNSLCDGKLDCIDESDEKDCRIGTGLEKFEAQEKYNRVIKMLNLRSSKQYLLIQKMFFNLRELIIKLQKMTLKYVADISAVRKLRNECYNLIRNIYSEMLKQSSSFDESVEAYIFLLSINENLGAALKLSHTGNSRIIGEGCVCRNGSCVRALCSKVCIKACKVEHKLMSYQCRGYNATVSLDDICNNKQDCPNGFDEFNCKRDDICRRHHLIILRNSLQEVGKNFKGTALGELLISWKTKVVSTINFAEKNGRPKPQTIRNIVKDILRDLLVTYGSVESYRRTNTDYGLLEFLSIAQIVMENIKLCGQ